MRKEDYKAANSYPRIRDLDEPLRTEFQEWLSCRIESYPLPYKWQKL